MSEKHRDQVARANERPDPLFMWLAHGPRGTEHFSGPNLVVVRREK